MKIENVLGQIAYDKVQSKRLVTNGEQQLNILSIEKGSELPVHTSVKDATIVVLEGSMTFSVDGQDHQLKSMDTYSFGSVNEHSARATENVKFLLVQ
jgi:quercetin dioxygenase-like cupin family protein